MSRPKGKRQTPAIELDEILAADMVRKGHLDRLVDAARAARQGALKLLRPVGGEDEQDIRILLQSIHLVEKPVEQRFLARPHLVAIARNQIDILDHDYRRLQETGKIHDVSCGCLDRWLWARRPPVAQPRLARTDGRVRRSRP
jgi:hypothetical protein